MEFDSDEEFIVFYTSKFCFCHAAEIDSLFELIQFFCLLLHFHVQQGENNSVIRCMSVGLLGIVDRLSLCGRVSLG